MTVFNVHVTYTLDRAGQDASAQLTARLLRRLADELEGA